MAEPRFQDLLSEVARAVPLFRDYKYRGKAASPWWALYRDGLLSFDGVVERVKQFRVRGTDPEQNLERFVEEAARVRASLERPARTTSAARSVPRAPAPVRARPAEQNWQVSRDGLVTLSDPAYEYGKQRGGQRGARAQLGLYGVQARPGRWRAMFIADDDAPEFVAWNARYDRHWERMLRDESESLGTVAVDSGTLVLVDDAVYPAEGESTGDYYDDASFYGATMRQLERDQAQPVVPLFGGRGVGLQNFGGDGASDVRGAYDDRGALAALRISFA